MSLSDLADLLMVVFEIEPNRANTIAGKLDIRKFDSNFMRLEALVGGFENAREVVKEGSFLSYGNGDIENYFAIASQAASKIDYLKPVPVQVFYSISSLTEFLRTEKAKEIIIDASKIKVHKYRLLHRDNTQSHNYLTSLIENGILTVERHEHWAKSGDGQNGLRGLNIIRKIAYDLTILFDELGLPKPEYKLKHGQLKLSIPPYTSVILGKIRDAAYSLQK